MQVPQQVFDDLRYALGFFPLKSLIHVRASRSRLIRGHYRRDGKGCLFNLLSEVLPADQQIISRETLTRFFTGVSGEGARDLPEYQPARWLVRLVDGQNCEGRYGSYTLLDWDVVMKVMDVVIAERTVAETESARTERRILRILRNRNISR
ncbi:MAG TPA: hypothetical protein VH518_23100 [Tepidisphaeraceae bacterium]|jgi:hypothetical protein